jgi:hypothetical protein
MNGQVRSHLTRTRADGHDAVRRRVPDGFVMSWPSSSAYQCPGRGHRAQRRRCAIGMRQPWTRRSRRLLVTMTVTSRVPGLTAEVLGHKHVVHIAAVDEELFAQSPLLAEAETFVQAQRRIVRAQHP